MKTRIFTITVCLLLLVSLMAWAKSYVPGELHVRAEDGSLYFIDMHPQWARNYESVVFLDSLRRGIPSVPVSTWRVMGFEWIHQQQQLRWGYFAVGVPFWALCLPLACLAVWGVLAWRRDREHSRPGVCRKCGYDLHGSSGRCPECGTAVSDLPL